MSANKKKNQYLFQANSVYAQNVGIDEITPDANENEQKPTLFNEMDPLAEITLIDAAKNNPYLNVELGECVDEISIDDIKCEPVRILSQNVLYYE